MGGDGIEGTENYRWLKWKERMKRGGRIIRRVLPFSSGVLAAFLALLLYNKVIPGPQPLTTRQVKDTVIQVMSSATPPPAFSAQVYQIIQPSLVLIEARPPGMGGDNSQESLGTGVVVDTSGDILTALHVIAGAGEIQLTFADGSTSTGQQVAQQPENDIAVIRADHPPAQLVPAVLSSPNGMRVGDEAYVVGNPFGLYSSMSAGVISGFNRSFHPTDSDKKIDHMIQFDAAANPGNSGGPLLNRYGQVIGIVEGIINPDGKDFFVGIGFAVPIDIAVQAAGSPQY